jgi:hypothetical protein
MKKEAQLIFLALSLIVFSVAASAEITFDILTPTYGSALSGTVITFNCTATASVGDITNVTIAVYYGANGTGTFITNSTTTDLFGSNNGTLVTLDISSALRDSAVEISNLSGNTVPLTYNCVVGDNQGSEATSSNIALTNNLISFFGYVKNSTYDNTEGANITFSEETMGGSGPPTTTLITSTLTNASGYYAFFVNGSAYSMASTANIKIGVQINGSDGNITEVGPSLPPLPMMAIMMFFANGTLYTQPAATLRLSATYMYNPDNSSVDTQFNYDITDLGIGLGLWNSIQTAATSYTDIVVPRDRNYSITWMRSPTTFTQDASPPLSTTLTNISAYSATNYVIELTKNLTFDQYQLSGYISISGNATEVNCTTMITRLTPGEGNFVPPGSTINGLEWNITGSDITGQSFKYDATLMGASDGINYVIEWYCNGTNEYYGAIRKVQVNSSNSESNNIIATALAGTYDDSGAYSSAAVNTSTKCIQIYDMTDPANPSTSINDLNLNLEVTDSSFGTLFYVTQVSSGAAVNWTFLNSSTVKVRIFSQQFPPYRTSIDLNKDYCGPDSNISLKPFNMETIDSSGAKEEFSSTALRMRFMRNSAACNVVSPADSCAIGDTLDPNTFNPLAAMMSGKTNLMIDLNGGNGTSLYFINVDMMSSGPPDAILSENASSDAVSTSSMDQIWQFGSFAPDIYDYVLVGIPYNDSAVNEAWTFTTKIPALYDENWNVIWNTTDNGTSFTEISGNYSDYADYSSTWFSGMTCSKTESAFESTSCYVNISENKIWLKLPHFSGVGPNLQGSTPTTSSSGGGSSTSTSTSTSGGLYIDTSQGISLELQVGDRAVFVTKGTEHTITTTQVALDHVTFEIQSTPIIVVVPVGESKEVDINNDGTNELKITVKSVNIRYGTADVYIEDVETPVEVPIPTGDAIQQVEQPPEEQPKIQEEQPTTEGKSSAIQTVIGIVIVLAAILLAFYLFSRRKTKS